MTAVILLSREPSDSLFECPPWSGGRLVRGKVRRQA